MNTASRRKVLGGLGVVGVGLMLSSTAYACTTYLGQVVASGNGAGNSAQTWVGSGSGMQWCAPPTPAVKVTSGSSSISMVTSATPRVRKCAAASQMSAGTYSVGVTTPGIGHMPQGGGSGLVHNCHGTTGSDVLVATGTVNASGVFSNGAAGSTVSWTTPAGVGPNSICIYKNGGPDAIAVNINQV